MSDDGMLMEKPTGLSKFFMDFPTYLYRMRVGFIFGKTFLVLVHRGRKSGTIYRTALEPLTHDLIDGEYRVISGRGSKADWFRNLEAHGPIEVWIGAQRMGAVHRVLGSDEAAESVAAHIAKYPRLSRRISPELVEAHEHGRLQEELEPVAVVGLRPEQIVYIEEAAAATAT